MNFDNQSLLLKKITHVFLGTYDFRELANRAVILIVKELKNKNVVIAGIGRMHEKDNLLYAYAYATKYHRTIDKLLPAKFSEFNIPLSGTDNFSVRAATTNQIQQSPKIADFSRGILSESLSDKIQKIVGAKLMVGLPIRVRSRKVAGVLLLGLRNDKLTGDQLVLFETIAEQLGLAFSNVFAFEKLAAKYDQNVARQSLAINVEDVPTIKFTLRITPKENELLEKLAREQGQTKAEIIRGLLDKTEP